MARILTHHVNVANPNSGKVQTFEPGAELPRWAAQILINENHFAYPEESKQAQSLVKQWQASKLAAEATADLQG